MNEQLIRWDDLQIVQAIAETGSLSGASRRLNLSHATVFRRLGDMEQRMGVKLFERLRSGYTPTLSGEDLANVAAGVEAKILGAERRIIGQDLKLSGSLRVTTTDTLFSGLLAPIFADFRDKFPETELQVVISNQVHSLSKREADIAIRPSGNPPETLIGKRVGNIKQAVYGHREQWANVDLPVPVESLPTVEWVGPDVHMGYPALESWMDSNGRRGQCRYLIDSMLGMQAAARCGAGVSVLPCYLGSVDDELVQVTQPIESLTVPLWLLTHPDLRKVRRVHVFLEYIGVRVRSALESLAIR